MSKSSALMDETPIMFQPSLAKLVGLHEAIVLQTLRFWCNNKRSGKIIDGERWIYNSAAEWRELSFPFWSTKTIGEIFLTLESMGLVKSEQFDLKEGKARKYYTLTQAACTILTIERADQLEESSDTMWKNVLGDVEDSSRSARASRIKHYTESLTENTKPPTPFGKGEAFSDLRSALNSDKDVNADAIDSRPPHQCEPASSAVRQKSPPIELPPELDCPDLRSAWNDFVAYRKERKKPVTPTTAKILFNRMKAWGADTSADALRDSIANGWQGVFPPKESNRPNVI
jgi:DNA-binding PadR family transcriptional regulator